MSIPHINAALQCREFTGTTRLLLIVLADSASNGKSVNRKNLPPDFSSLSLLGMMRRLNTHRRQTISDCLKELREAGVIRTIHRKQKASLTIVSLGWLESHSFTEEDKVSFAAASPELNPLTNQACTENVDREDTASKLPANDNAKRAGKTTQSVQACAKQTTENVVNDNAKRAGIPLIPHPTGSQKSPASQAMLIPPLSGEKRASSLRSNSKPKTKPTPPVTKPVPLPLTPEETCAECGGFYLDCPLSHKSGTVDKPFKKEATV
jgi:hypothetical protein